MREAVATLAAQVAAEGGIDPRDILELTFVGNPIMHHLLLGIDPTELGGAPFALATDEAITLWASELDQLGVHANARVYVLPCIAGHVGADTAGVVLSETPHLADEVTLIVDVGTNAEIVLGNRHRLLAAPRRPARRSRARRSPAASARRPARSSACGSTARRSSRATR